MLHIEQPQAGCCRNQSGGQEDQQERHQPAEIPDQPQRREDRCIGAHAVPEGWTGAVEWAAKAAMDGVFGLAWGLVLIPLATKVIGPLLGILKKKQSGHQ